MWESLEVSVLIFVWMYKYVSMSEINDALCSWFSTCSINNAGKDMILGEYM